jgi:hypothetical protein
MMMKCWAEIVALGAMWGPRRTSVWFIVDEDMHAKYRYGMCDKIVGVTVEALVGANVGVGTVGAEIVYGDFGLWKGFVPKLKGK